MKRLDELQEISELVLADKSTADLSQITIQCAHIKEFKKQAAPKTVLEMIKTIRDQQQTLNDIATYGDGSWGEKLCSEIAADALNVTEKVWGGSQIHANTRE